MKDVEKDSVGQEMMRMRFSNADEIKPVVIGTSSTGKIATFYQSDIVKHPPTVLVVDDFHDKLFQELAREANRLASVLPVEPNNRKARRAKKQKKGWRRSR